MADKVKVVYSGSLSAVTFDGGVAERGVPVEVDASLAVRLCEQRSWNAYEEPQKPAPKKAAKAEKEDSE